MMLALSIAVLGATAWLFNAVPKGFIPTEDHNELSTQLEFREGISYGEISREMLKLTDIVRGDPAVDSYSTSVGGSSGGDQYRADFLRSASGPAAAWPSLP